MVIIGVFLIILVVGVLGYYLIANKSNTANNISQENQTNQITDNKTTQNLRFLYVVNEQRRKNDDPRNWETDYYTLISYNPVLDKKDIIYETSSAQLFKESGETQTSTSQPKEGLLGFLRERCYFPI